MSQAFKELQRALVGNLCRCTGYVTIDEARRWAAEQINMRGVRVYGSLRILHSTLSRGGAGTPYQIWRHRQAQSLTVTRMPAW
jgi:hypothetical protein